MSDVASSRGATSIVWRRLDTPGHDAATCRRTERGAELRGMAVFRDAGGPAALRYFVRCDVDWQTIEGTVDGWCGATPFDLRFVRSRDGGWTLNGAACSAAAGCLDLDLSFTPATNLMPLRRLKLAVGQMAEVRSAWLEWPGCALTPLVQRYARKSLFEYDYEADLPGTASFAGVLRVEPNGWVLDYAGLWQAESDDTRGLAG